MKTMFITGGSRGIGAEMIRTFARAGYLCAFSYKNSAAAAARITQETGAFGICADVADPAQAAAAVQSAEKRLGHIDVLISNAGVAQQQLFTDITDEDWQHMLAINLSGAFYTIRTALPGMISRKHGSILLISSMWGQVGASCEVAYSACKAGLIGMTKALAKETGPSGVRVNCICPGVIDTDMNQALGADTLAALAADTPLERLGTASDVARSALFLTGDEAAFITGQVLGVNGGFVI